MSGYLAQFYTAETERLSFGVVGAVAMAFGALLALFSRPIRALMSGVR